jgi:hypothetical protein
MSDTITKYFSNAKPLASIQPFKNIGLHNLRAGTVMELCYYLENIGMTKIYCANMLILRYATIPDNYCPRSR